MSNERRASVDKYDRGLTPKDMVTISHLVELWKHRDEDRKIMKSSAVAPWIRFLCLVRSDEGFAEEVATELGVTTTEFLSQLNQEFRVAGKTVYSLRVFLAEDPDILIPEDWKKGF
jgi:hypothetical protein